MKNKIISSVVAFAVMGAMLYASIPAIAAIVFQGMFIVCKDLFFNILCKPTEINQVLIAEGVGTIIAFVLCLLTGNIYWGF